MFLKLCGSQCRLSCVLLIEGFLNLQRDCGRPPIPRKDPGDNPVEEPLLSNHPYVDKVCPGSTQ